MTTNQLEKYEFNVRSIDPDELSDHELLLVLVKEVKDIKTRLVKVEDILERNNLR